MIIDGKEIANNVLEKIKALPRSEKFLAAFLVGDNPASISFLNQKEKVAKDLGIDFRLYKFREDIENDELRGEIRKIIDHKTCGGAIVQLPLPEHINNQYVLNVIPREKDIDVLGERALGAFYVGRNPVLPPAVGVIEEILKKIGDEISGLRVVVVGRGALIGKPISVWLTDKVRELIVLGHSADLRILKEADIVISGVGKAGIIKPDMLKDEAGMIDFGYDVSGGKIYGDFDVSSLTPITYNLTPSFFTPTPGGTGPILVAKLFENFYRLNQTEKV